MPLQASTDRELDRAGRRFNQHGSRFLLLGGIMAAIGIVLMTIGDEWVVGVGVALATLGTPPTLLGLGLMLSGLTSRRSAQHKPFA